MASTVPHRCAPLACCSCRCNLVSAWVEIQHTSSRVVGLRSSCMQQQGCHFKHEACSYACTQHWSTASLRGLRYGILLTTCTV
eukprot:1157517-Pelagomonas_calceolata.AAC.8